MRRRIRGSDAASNVARAGGRTDRPRFLARDLCPSIRWSQVIDDPERHAAREVDRQRFERMGVFDYSLETDTPAASLAAQIPVDVRQARRERLMQVQQQVAFQWNQAQVGRRMQVILDSPVPNEPSAWIGRSQADAPDVDGLVYVSGVNLRTGQIVNCEIVTAREYDLIAAAI